MNRTNNFVYFEKSSDGLYECNNSTQKNLTREQLDLLNNLYTNYITVKHPYSHWLADDYDKAMINNISIAREY